MSVLCKYCRVLKVKEQAGKSGDRFIYRDGAGKRWRGARCPECCVPDRKRSNSARPNRPIDECRTYHTQKGRLSERAVFNYLTSLGYPCRLTRCKGPDIIISLPGEEVTCEVKSVTKVGGCHYVSEVSPARKCDDLVALVFPNGRIHFDLMPAHLALCGNGGKRVVSSLVGAA